MARVLQTGFEFPGTGPTVGTGSAIPASWVTAASMPSLGLPITAIGTAPTILKQGTSTTSTFPISHKSLTGIGGSCYALITGSNGSGIIASMTNGISEGTIGFAYRSTSSATDGLLFYAQTSSGQQIFTLRYAYSKFYLVTGNATLTGTMTALDGAANLVGSYSGAPDSSVWSWITIEFKIHPTAGPAAATTAGFVIGSTSSAAQSHNGAYTFTLVGSNKWVGTMNGSIDISFCNI